MDVLMFTRNEEVFRAGSTLEALLKEYAHVGKHLVVMVLTKKGSPYTMTRVADNLWIIPVSAPLMVLTPWWAAREARRQLFFQGRLQTDLIDGRDASLAGLAAWLVGRRYHKPLHLFLSTNTVSGSYGGASIVRWFEMLLSRFLVPAADALSTDAAPVRTALIAVAPQLSERITLLPHTVDFSALPSAAVAEAPRATPQETSLYPRFKFLILVVAPLVPESNIRLAISVLAGVLRVYPYTGLLIIGSGPEQHSLAALAAKIGVGRNVVFEEKVADLARYFQRAQMFLNTARDSQDDTVAAAAAAGCVVVSTHGGIASQLIKHGVNGFLCEVTDPGCFVTSITRLIRYPVMRERVRANLALATEQRTDDSLPEGQLAPMRRSWELAAKNFQALQSTKSPH